MGGTFGDPHWPTRNVVLADLNGDGFPDIAVANRLGPAQVCFNDGHAQFKCKPFAPETSATILAADMNGDGAIDLILACRDNCQSVIYFNDGSGKKYTRVPFGDNRGAICGIAVADLDGDGWPDIVAARSDAPSMIFFSRPSQR